MFPKLNLPDYSFNIKDEGGKKMIFDENRKKFIILTPEEWVRQNFIQYLVTEKRYPKSLISIEMSIIVNGLAKRCDAVIYNKFKQPVVIIEFKAPNVKITSRTFDQITRYNFKLKVDYLIVSNGLVHHCCKMDYEKQKANFWNEIPLYTDIVSL